MKLTQADDEDGWFLWISCEFGCRWFILEWILVKAKAR